MTDEHELNYPPDTLVYDEDQELEPYRGPSCQQLAETIQKALTTVQETQDEAEGVLGKAFVRSLVGVFQDALEAVKDHFSGPDGEPVPVLDVRPCSHEIKVAALAQALLELDAEDDGEQVQLQIVENGGAAVVELHVRGEHKTLSKEFDSLQGVVDGLHSMANEIATLIPTEE